MVNNCTKSVFTKYVRSETTVVNNNTSIYFNAYFYKSSNLFLRMKATFVEGFKSILLFVISVVQYK